MFIQKKAVKELIHANGKMATDDALDAIDYKVHELICRICKNAGPFRKLEEVDVYLVKLSNSFGN